MDERNLKPMREAETKPLQKHDVMQGWLNLSNEALAEAFTILYGRGWKAGWPVKSKASEMRSIILGNDQPCRPLLNFHRCITFLQEKASRQFICRDCKQHKPEWLGGLCEDCTLKGFGGK